MKLLKVTFALVSKHVEFYICIFLFGVTSFVLPPISTYVFKKLSVDFDKQLCIAYCMLQLITHFVFCIFGKTLNLLCNKIKKDYKLHNYKKYDALTYESKISRSVSRFKTTLDESLNGIDAIIDWGSKVLCNLLCNLVSVISAFYFSGSVWMIIVYCIAYAIAHVFWLKKLKEENIKFNSKNHDEVAVLEEKLNLNYVPFQYKETTCKRMIDLENQIIDARTELRAMRNKLHNNDSGIITTLSLIISYCASGTASSFVIVTTNIESFRSSLSGSMYFFNHYNGYCLLNYSKMCEFWKGAKFNEEIDELKLKKNAVSVNKLEVSRGKYSLQLNANFSLKKGKRVLIEGPTGHGKSTFLKAIFGLIESANVVLSKGLGKNYYNTVVEYFQEIKEKTPTSKTTLRDIFKEEEDDALVTDYLRLAWGNECDRIISNIGGIDSPIDEKISGGEKSRMLLWNRGYIASKYNKEIIILDEPIPDVDFETYITQMNSFMKRYSNKMIIIIAHLCECKRKKLNFEGSTRLFDQELWVSDGTIVEKNKSVANVSTG